MVAGHPFDVSKSLLSGSYQLRSTLFQPPLVLVLLVEPANQKFSYRLDHFMVFLVHTHTPRKTCTPKVFIQIIAIGVVEAFQKSLGGVVADWK